MKLIIAGSRDIYITSLAVSAIISSLQLQPTEIVSGGCKGPDKIGEDVAYIDELTLKVFKADWQTYGKAAGPIRNREMANYADKLLLIWDGKSKGSYNMKKEMGKLNKPVYEIIIKTPTYQSEDDL